MRKPLFGRAAPCRPDRQRTIGLQGWVRQVAHSAAPGEAGMDTVSAGMGENGAGDEIRTHDINLGKVALYP